MTIILRKVDANSSPRSLYLRLLPTCHLNIKKRVKILFFVYKCYNAITDILIINKKIEIKTIQCLIKSFKSFERPV